MQFGDAALLSVSQIVLIAPNRTRIMPFLITCEHKKYGKTIVDGDMGYEPKI